MGDALNRAMERFGWRGYDGEEAQDFYEEPEALPEYDEPEPVTPMPRPEIVSSRATGIDISRIVSVTLNSYADAELIGNALRDGVPVIINLSKVSEMEARRIIDFSAGLAFGLNGSMEQVVDGVILLTPESVRVVEGQQKSSFHDDPLFLRDSGTRF
ncbi:MAG: cell division protein SepF [Actinomycetaceae bacterium]|nr:cell division protein SepF [Actinomycetaceae bacterium]